MTFVLGQEESLTTGENPSISRRGSDTRSGPGQHPDKKAPKLSNIAGLLEEHPILSMVERFDAVTSGTSWEGYHESGKCSRGTYPESYISAHTSIRRKESARFQSKVVLIQAKESVTRSGSSQPHSVQSKALQVQPRES